MFQYPIKAAAQLAEAGKHAKTHPSVAPLIRRALDRGDVTAFMLNNGVLLLPGSNSVGDYILFNLRVFKIGGKRYRLEDSATATGHSGAIWHQGFLTYSKAIFDHFADIPPKFIIGHSLGAAAAQILAKSWGVPAISFAAPRPRWGATRLRNEQLSLSILRNDDLVTTLPGGFRHLGTAKNLKPRSNNAGLDHQMRHYRRIVDEHAGSLPAHWP